MAEQTLRALFLRKPPQMGQLVPAEGIMRFSGNLAFTVRDVVTWDSKKFETDLARMLRSTAITRLPYNIYENATGEKTDK